MNLIEAVKQMSYLSDPNVKSLKDTLKDGYHIIVGDRNNYGDDMLTYDLFIDDDILLVGRLSDSSSTEIVISIEMVIAFEDKYLEYLWTSYLSGKDFFIVDTMGYMHDAKLNSSGHVLENLKSAARAGEIIYLNNTYTNPTLDFLPKTCVYIEDNEKALVCGYEAAKVAAETVTNTTVTSDRNKADFIILILSNATRAPHDNFFQWLDESNKDIPDVKDTLKQKKLAYNKPHSILLYWSFNVMMAGFISPRNAQFKAANEFANAINEFHGKK